jgi:hypothetical protein
MEALRPVQCSAAMPMRWSRVERGRREERVSGRARVIADVWRLHEREHGVVSTRAATRRELPVPGRPPTRSVGSN